jgi:DNA-binding transcriptional regulator PaaX
MKVVKKITKGDVSRVVLETVKTTGVLATALILPNAVASLNKLGIIDINRSKKQSITTARIRLLKAGMITKDAKGFLRITEKGEKQLHKYELSEYQLVIPKIWDGKWRVLIFDIPEHRKSLRDKIRRTLTSIGFKRVQDSVWVFPHDCSELISLLKVDFKVGKDLLYMTVDELENDRSLKGWFHL